MTNSGFITSISAKGIRNEFEMSLAEDAHHKEEFGGFPFVFWLHVAILLFFFGTCKNLSWFKRSAKSWVPETV
jgi:hypothetical protein